MESTPTGKNPTFFVSAMVAARGFVTVVRKERKIRLALVVLSFALGLALWRGLPRLECLFIFAAWTQVIVGEIFNTSLEKAMDYASGKEFHPLIKRGKDYAAASVFVLSVLASIITVVLLAA